jgi:hypothetical protein
MYVYNDLTEQLKLKILVLRCFRTYAVFLFQEDDKEEAIQAFRNDVQNRTLNLNVEYRLGNVPYVTLINPTNNDGDIAKSLILEGLLLFENRTEKRLQKLVSRTIRSCISLLFI